MFAYTIEMAELEILDNDLGWGLYSFDREWQRMGIPGDLWRVSLVNEGYKSLPERLIVPAGVSDEILSIVSTFRGNSRLPSLSLYHKHTKAFIARSGQPLIGSKGKRCVEDEHYLKDLLANRIVNPDGTPLPCIVDARTKATSSSAKSRGGGSEADGNYVGIRTFYTTIESPSTLKEYYEKFVDAIRNIDGSMGSYLTDTTGWFRQVQSCLRPAAFIAKCVAVQGSPVLIHCDDGLDNTSVLVSLAKILIDPYYRTLNGFMILLEEDWIQSGFRFSDRCGVPSAKPQIESLPSSPALPSIPFMNSSLSSSSSPNTPVFLLFLDCVFQIWSQFPTEFEFNLEFLSMLHQQTSANQFGTFIANTPKEYEELKEHTFSLWAYFNSRFRKHYKNACYNPLAVQLQPLEVLPISTDSKRLKLWSGMYDPFSITCEMYKWNQARFRVDVTGPLDLVNEKMADIEVTLSQSALLVYRLRKEVDEKKKEVQTLVASMTVTDKIGNLAITESSSPLSHGDVQEKHRSWDPLNATQ